MEAYIRDMLLSAGRYVPSNIVKSYFLPKSSREVAEARRKLGEPIKGICHPSGDLRLITAAGITWYRADCPVPFDAQGELREEYIRFKEHIAAYADAGIRIFLVTPYPQEYIREAGLDPRLSENEARLREAALFLLEDLRPCIGAMQITNEMGAPRFTLPLNLDEACRYMGVQLAALYPRRGDVLIGYNIAGPSANVVKRMKPWRRYCDFVGIDIYIGCFAPVGNWLFVFDLMLRYIWAHAGKPVILTEFGYIGAGQPKTKAERQAILRSYGAESESEARRDIKAFAKRLNPKMQGYMEKNASGDWGDFLFLPDFRNHFYKELPKGFAIKKYPHTPVGQADFYRDLIPRLMKYPFMLGFCMYCWHDTDDCFCGQPDCPIENNFGITDIKGNPKPAYYAVQDALSEVRF
jgi:hypothetical protein